MKTIFYLLFSLLLLLSSIPAFAQVGIGTNTPAASAVLEVSSSSNNKGILIPRITATQKDAISNPAEGLMIYQTSAPTGFYYYTNNSWRLMVTQTDLDAKVTKVSGKDLSSNDYSSAEKTKLAGISGSNTGDQTTITGNAGTATKLAAPKNINGVAFDGSSDITITSAAAAEQLTGSTLKSTVTGSSLTSVGTLANLTVTNPITGSVTGSSGSTTGNAATATKLAATKNINGVAFDGSADITITSSADAGTLAGSTLKSTVTGSSLTSVGTLANLTVTNPITGSVTGNSGSTTGNAATATKLAATKNINGVAFDGTGDITVTADAGTLTGTTLKSTVTGSGLTSVGTLADLTVTNPITGSITGSSGSTTGNAATVTNGIYTTNKLNALAVTSSAELAGVISNETGSGNLVFSNSPTLVSPDLGAPSFISLINGYNLPLATGTSGFLPISKGGTGESTKFTAFNALSPMTQSGDIIYGGISGQGTRLAKGTDGQVLTLNSGLPTWTTAISGGVSSVGSISNFSNANGATITNGVLNLTAADANNSGLITNGTQNISGPKNFTSNITVNGTTIGKNGAPGFFVTPINPDFINNRPALTYDINSKEIAYDPFKTFVIDHPTKSNSYLVHACLEGPEAGVYYRGESKIENNKSVTVQLPDYVSSFANNFSIQITPIYSEDSKQNIVYRTSRVENNAFTVHGKKGSFYWIVYAQRGEVEVEPKKSETELTGDGPYKYIKTKK